jgi:hypothetical protein
MLLLPVADSLGILGVPEVVLVLRFDQPSPHEFALSDLAALGFEAITLSLAAPVIGKKKLLAVQALVSSSGRLHRFQNQKEPVLGNRPNRRNKIPPGKKTQAGEEGRRVCSESFEEKPRRRRSIPRRPFCLSSISPVA